MHLHMGSGSPREWCIDGEWFTWRTLHLWGGVHLDNCASMGAVHLENGASIESGSPGELGHLWVMVHLENSESMGSGSPGEQ